ncbi:MAG: glycosyltransferase [Gemmatimonadetes bacterium]|nr:glycosyltransferase [Gemmatimonadota bacterium]
MRVLKVTQFYYPYLEKGGPALKVRALSRHLMRRGHAVTVLTADFGARRAAPADPAEPETIYLSTLVRYRTSTVSPSVVGFCRRRLAEFDVVHLYGLYDLLGPVVAAFCRARGTPYVLEPLGMYRPIVRSLLKKRLYQRLVTRRLEAGAARLIATSEQERWELIEAGVAAEKLLVRRNGVELEEFVNLPPRGAFRRVHSISESERLVLYLGRLSRKKGLDLLLRAFAGVSAHARLAIAGPDDRDGCLAGLHRLARELGLGPDRLLLCGPHYGRAKLEALVDADVFVLPSQNENFGNAAAEAIACGTPALVTDQCGIAPWIDGRAGLVVAHDVQALRNGLACLLEGDTVRRRLRDGCDEVARMLSWDAPVTEMEALYASVARQSGPRRVQTAAAAPAGHAGKSEPAEEFPPPANSA